MLHTLQVFCFPLVHKSLQAQLWWEQPHGASNAYNWAWSLHHYLGQQRSSQWTFLPHLMAHTKPVAKSRTELQTLNLCMECCSHEAAPFCSSQLQAKIQHWTVRLNRPFLEGFDVLELVIEGRPSKYSIRTEERRSLPLASRPQQTCLGIKGIQPTVSNPPHKFRPNLQTSWAQRKEAEEGTHLYLSSGRWVKEIRKFPL